MKRASQERIRTLKEWSRRHPYDAALEPGRFRKGRRARGCPGRCPCCRAVKRLPSLQQLRADIEYRESLAAS